jgi:hypothetical protein
MENLIEGFIGDTLCRGIVIKDYLFMIMENLIEGFIGGSL